jgi:hypothetical protein
MVEMRSYWHVESSYDLSEDTRTETGDLLLKVLCKLHRIKVRGVSDTVEIAFGKGEILRENLEDLWNQAGIVPVCGITGCRRG